MTRTFSFFTAAVGALALVAAGAPDLSAQRGGGRGQGKPPSTGPVNPGQPGGKPGGAGGGGNPGGGNPNVGGGNPNRGGGNQGGGNPNAGGGNPNRGGGNQGGGNPNAGGGNPNRGGGNQGGGNPNAGGGGRGRGNAGVNPPDNDGGREGRGGGRGNAANGSRDAEGFKNYGQMVAARHVSENLGIDFDDLKALMTGDDPKSLGQAIQELRPEADANAEAAKAEKQAEASGN